MQEILPASRSRKRMKMREKMELPTFKYSPNAYQLDLFEEEEGICSICHEKRTLK